ncbi:glucan 1,6-alpha-glucosidase [Trichoderma gamsii]|uniref:Alpha-glucosidase n=1 Tax=Trichoderma gamsii TaxID=398673 RepID=A0A2P4Z778_9HYPO|nr:glucan 1,6-alpha-glucosidase [Trichoderma gamsii]PON20155.1 glucan 1,6-alpha-glucosidase [Trichoderma gamsii]
MSPSAESIGRVDSQPTEHRWWKEGVIYQVYPASFMDANGDGLGDIRGIISKLDYIKSLGATTVWICPHYDSPQIDLGYDIADYESVYPPYGTLKDMDDLIAGCHARGLRIIVDLVINHTSDQHKWFKESRSSKDSLKRDWYIWRPAKYDAQGNRQPPNNWRSNFSTAAWTWDEHTQEYYLHLFCPEQPDLNWENPETRKAIYATAIEFWLKRGVDGFRVDTVNMYSKPEGLPDAPILNPDAEHQVAASLYCNGPRMSEYLSEMNHVMSPYDTMTVGECPATPDRNRVIQYVSAASKQLNMVFQFDVVDVGQGKETKYNTVPFNWKLPELKQAINSSQSLIVGADAWTTSFMENHDQARSISRFASDAPEFRVQSGKMLAMLNATLSGTLFIYQGQEIGMINMPESWPVSEYKDVESSNFYNSVARATNNDPKALAKAKAAIQHLSRDHARYPMCWDSTPQGGYSSNTETWMRVHDLAGEINVAQQESDPNSVLAFWRLMLQMRKQHAAALVHGYYEIIDFEDEMVFSYWKKGRGETALVVLNFTSQEQPWTMPPSWQKLGLELVVSTQGKTKDVPDALQAFEGRVYIKNH